MGKWQPRSIATLLYGLGVCIPLAALIPFTRAQAGQAPSQELEQSLQRAIAFHQQADYSHSLPILRELVVRLPRNYAANLLLGRDLLSNGEVKAAIAPLELAASLQPGDGTAEVFLAEANSAAGDYPKASLALEAGLERSHAAAPYLEPWVAFCMERFRAIEMLLRETHRGEATAFRVEADLHPEGSKLRQTLLEQSASGDPQQHGIWGELGLAQLEAGEVAAARHSLENSRGDEPDGTGTLELDALLALAQGDWLHAEPQLVRLRERSPAEWTRAAALWRRVLAARFATDARAWPCLRSETASCPELKVSVASRNAATPEQLYLHEGWEKLAKLPAPSSGSRQLLWRGIARAHVGNCRQAIPDLERSLKTDLLDAGLWLDICYATEGEEAAAQLSQSGDTLAFHQLRGDLLLRLRGDAAGARQEYAEAARLSPRDAHVLARLAEADMQLGNAEEAEREGVAALTDDRQEASALHTLASIALNHRDYSLALDRLKQLEAADPGDKWARLQSGVCLAQLGRPEEAVELLAPVLGQGYPDPKGAFHAQLARMLRKLGRDREAAQAEGEAVKLANSSLSREQENHDPTN